MAGAAMATVLRESGVDGCRSLGRRRRPGGGSHRGGASAGKSGVGRDVPGGRRVPRARTVLVSEVWLKLPLTSGRTGVKGVGRGLRPASTGGWRSGAGLCTRGARAGRRGRSPLTRGRSEIYGVGTVRAPVLNESRLWRRDD